MREQPFTFAALDGIAFAAARGRLQDLPPHTMFAAGALGPFLELTQLGATGFLPRLDKAAWLALDGIAGFETALRGGRKQWICPAGHTAGFFRTDLEWSEDETAWVGFGLAAQKAVIAAGFHRRIAAQFAGALGEMVSNIHEHSGAAASGLAAFRAGSREFEFVVADGGMGVLDSLRSCPDYAHLDDHGEALQLALTDGVSRFGPQAKRGGGFRPIFVGLANLSGSLRFRSGDHALVIDGRRINSMAAKMAQKAHLKGFLVSVACRLREERYLAKAPRRNPEHEVFANP
jgi:anti-sigma regulatory factor (Ser/Thr protein kinase)